MKLVLKLDDLEEIQVSWQQLHSVLENSTFKCHDQVYKNIQRSGRDLCVVIESIQTRAHGSITGRSATTANVEGEEYIARCF